MKIDPEHQDFGFCLFVFCFFKDLNSPRWMLSEAEYCSKCRKLSAFPDPTLQSTLESRQNTSHAMGTVYLMEANHFGAGFTVPTLANEKEFEQHVIFRIEKLKKKKSQCMTGPIFEHGTISNSTK